MKRKRIIIIGILLIVFVLLFTGCSVRKNVRIKEVREFTRSILESNEKIKELDFYFVRPYLGSHLVYDGDLDEEELQDLIDEFKTLINIEFMQRIGGKYWGGSRPSEFNLYVYIDTMNNKKEGDFNYLISSRYNKTYIHDEEPDNIDGYQTWSIYNKMKGESGQLLEDGVIDNWGIELNANDITPTGMTLECKQLAGETTGELQTGSYYFLEEEIDGEWVEVEMLPSEHEIGWNDMAFIITMKDTVVWNIDWKWLYGKLQDGNYRIGKEITDFRDTGDYDTKIYYANFEIEN